MSIVVQPLAPETGAPAGADRLRKQRVKHDMRQSLTAVMTLAAIVDRSLDRGPEVLKRLDQIRHETEWMTRLISSAGPCATDLAVLDVGDVVAEAWCSAVATTDCAIRLVRDARACACVDRDGLGRSVRNLLNNAVRAAGEDGTVVVEVRVHPATVDVVVRDDGPGFGNIPSQEGLGLRTVRRFACEHGGSVDVRRGELGGAEVALQLPRPTPQVCRPEEPPCGS